MPITRDGVREDVYWTYSYSPIDDESAPDGVGGVLTICTETTDTIHSAQRLAISEERLQIALSSGRGIGTWDWDLKLDLVVADARFAAIYGVDLERAAIGVSVEEFFKSIHADDLPRVREKVAHTRTTGALFSEEYRIRQADGRHCWVLAEGRCEMDDQRQPVRFSGVSFDITDRKTAELQLKELNTDLERKVVEKSMERGRTWQVSPEILGVLNGDGYFETSNPAWATILGSSQAEVSSRVFFEFVHPDDLEKTQKAWVDATQHGLPALRFENRYICKDGTYRWLSWVAVPEGGKVYCSARDVTDDKARAAALERAETALRQAQKMEAVGQLTGGLAHDFNNLLRGISGSLELIPNRTAQVRTDEIQPYVRAAQGAAKRAASLTHRLLAFSRLQTLNPKPVDINSLLAGVEDLIRRTAGPEIALDVNSAAGLWATLVDANQLENVIINLCINARDAMPHGGLITIETANCLLDEPVAWDLDLAPGGIRFAKCA